MARGVPITSRRGVQLAVVLFAAWLLVNAYQFATTGAGWILTPACTDQPSGPSAASYFAAMWRAIIGVGLIVVALKDLGGPRLRDPALLGLLLAFAAFSLLTGGANGLVTGVVRLGTNRCIEIAAPWSYGYATFALVAGTIALLAAVTVFRSGDDD